MVTALPARISRWTRLAAAAALVWAIVAVSVLSGGSLSARLPFGLAAAGLHHVQVDTEQRPVEGVRPDHRAPGDVLAQAKRRAAPLRSAAPVALLPAPLAAVATRPVGPAMRPVRRAGRCPGQARVGPRTAAERCVVLQVHRC